jgi:molybdopterin-guanine dinucleotide biosynthesis protein
MEPVTIVIRGPHDSGRTTLANLIKEFLEESAYKNVKVVDARPLPESEKDRWWDRFQRNRAHRPITIVVETTP